MKQIKNYTFVFAAPPMCERACVHVYKAVNIRKKITLIKIWSNLNWCVEIIDAHQVTSCHGHDLTPSQRESVDNNVTLSDPGQI